jgi:large subunit ribosomal protein L9
VTVKVNVARSPEEADLQAQGIDVMAQMFERDAAPPAAELIPESEPAPDKNADAEQATAETGADDGGATDDAKAPPATESAEQPAATGEDEPKA